MITRKAEAKWTGGLREGAGTVTLESGAFSGPYDFKSRFETGASTNPEELLGAAHAACFSMFVSATLGRQQITPEYVHTTARVHLDPASPPTVRSIELVTRARIPGMEEAKFLEVAQAAKTGCPISKALASVEITLDAALE